MVVMGDGVTELSFGQPRAWLILRVGRSQIEGYSEQFNFARVSEKIIAMLSLSLNHASEDSKHLFNYIELAKFNSLYYKQNQMHVNIAASKLMYRYNDVLMTINAQKINLAFYHMRV